MVEVVIPYAPRDQFIPYHKRSQRFAKVVAHRRFGKTVGTINDLIARAAENGRKQPTPQYAYIAPTWSQAKAVAWEYLKFYTAGIPGVRYSESELWVELPHNRARVRLYGADAYDRLRGLYLDGAVIDEPAQMDPRAWPTVIRPALSDYNGWATFIGTPEGRNWFYAVGRNDDGTEDPAWFHVSLRASETGILSEDELQSAARSLTPEQFAQEYECSFEAAIIGAYYGRAMAALEDAKQIGGVPYDPAAQVYTAWDLGINDPTCIWFAQLVGRELHIIDYIEQTGGDLGWFVREVRGRPYVYAQHFLPHDAKARELGTGKSRLETLDALGLTNVQVCPDHHVDDGINAVRLLLSRCWFDRAKCARGIDALKLYRSEFDEKHQTLKPKPVHDWTSHGADAFRYLAMGWDTNPAVRKPVTPHYGSAGGWMS